MDFTPYISFNRTVLLRLIADVFALIGLQGGERPETMTRAVRSTVLYTLRPAESAVRRLVFILATQLERQGYTPPRWVKRVGLEKPIVRPERHRQVPAFRLIDPRKWFWWIGTKSRPRAKHMPMISIIGYDDDRPQDAPPAPVPTPDDPMDAKHICNRLLALQAALEDLPRQAKRMLRLKAKDPKAFVFKAPMRPGLPPGWRQRGRDEIDVVLRECHQIAGWAREAPDTG